MAQWWSHIGAYAWVENLRPAPPGATRKLSGNRVVREQAHNGGFVHAPSMAHAATAAVLRSAYLTHGDEGAEGARYAFDLTSARVRTARALLDGVREGQPIGALLGYRFERFLHERALQVFLEPFRKAYPLVANKAGDPDTATNITPPRNVADGLAIRIDWRGAVDPIARMVNDGDGPTPDTAQTRDLRAAFVDLDEAVDGVSDLLTAEGVFQITRGNVAATSASIDALASGLRPPDPEVARTPRGGIPITHRVLWLSARDGLHPLWAGGNGAPAPGESARAKADAILDRWVGELLGDPREVVCWLPSPHGAFPLARLRLRPLDVLELARAALDSPGELERRILVTAYAPQLPPAGAKVRFTREDTDAFQPRTMRTFPELLEAARRVSTLLAQARPLAARDFTLLDGSDPELDPALVEAERLVAVAAVDRLRAIRTVLNSTDADALRIALVDAAEYQAEAFPPLAAEVRLHATNVAAELDKRIAAADKELARLTQAPPLRDIVAIASAALKAVFGDSFVRLGRFRVLNTAELTDIVNRSNQLLDDEREAPSALIHQMAKVRDGMAAWRNVWLHAQAIQRRLEPGGPLRRPRPVIHVAQLPYDPVEAWAGRAFDAATRPKGSRLSLVIHRTPPPIDDDAFPDLGVSLAGLVIDEWTEVIPNAEEQTGVAFHYDDPGAEAAQAVLIAVPPDRSQSHWSFDHLVAAIRETFELAKIRAVEPEALGALGQVLPATYLSASTRADAPGDATPDKADDVSTRFDGALTGERTFGTLR